MRLPEYQISNSTSMWVFRKLLYKQKLQIFFLLLWAGQKIIRWELTKIKTLDVRSISVGQYYIHQILCLDKLFQFINFSAVTFSTTSQNTLHKDIWRTMPILMFRTFHMYSSGNKFVVFCSVVATLQNTTNLFPLLYYIFPGDVIRSTDSVEMEN